MKTYQYLKLYEAMKKKIISGVYVYGDKLPSKRTIASETEVSVITVQHAYALLCDEGYVEARQRVGYVVIYRESDFIGTEVQPQAVGQSLQNGATHSRGEISYNILAKTMRKVLLDYGESILVKSPNAGCPELRSEIQAYLLRTRGIQVDFRQIIIGSGAEYLYSLVAQLMNPNQYIAVEHPSYDKITKVYRSMGHEIDPLQMGPDGILSSELARTTARVLHVTPFHSYPSQITASISKKREYLKWAGDDGYIIEDNYDSELTVSQRMEDALFSLAEGKHVIYINTFSKTIAPSIRMGYMILPENLVERFEERLGFYSCTVPVFEQYVISELLRSGDYQRHINRVRRKLRKAGQESAADKEG